MKPTSAGRRIVFAAMAGECPTRAELDAGIVLQEAGTHVVDLVGWDVARSRILVADGSSRFPKTIPGRQRRLGTPAMDDYGAALPLTEGDVGSLVVFTEGNVPALWRVAFAVPEEPRECSPPAGNGGA